MKNRCLSGSVRNHSKMNYEMTSTVLSARYSHNRVRFEKALPALFVNIQQSIAHYEHAHQDHDKPCHRA